MGKLFKIFALFLGTFTIATGLTSCKGEECCTWTDDYGDSYRYCEDDDFDAGYSFALAQAAAAYYGGSCKK